MIWRLGGKQSDFAFAPGADFAWQHDCAAHSDGTLSLFDNEAATRRPGRAARSCCGSTSRAPRVTLVHEYLHTQALLSGSQGDAQLLPNGHVFVGWGANPYVTEFTRDGTWCSTCAWRGAIDS